MFSDKKFVTEVSNHIEILRTLSLKIGQKPTFHEMKESWKKKEYWKGADVQVYDLNTFSHEEMQQKENETSSFSADEPCPTKHPEILSSLINLIDKEATYINFKNKFEFYGTIAKRCQYLSNKPISENISHYCRDIIFNQIRLLRHWKKLNFNFQPVIYHNTTGTLQDHNYYFGFGRNVNHNEMLSPRRCPNATYIGPAFLPNFRFIIDIRGYASIEPTPGEKVLGALWEVNSEDFRRLDLREGLLLASPSYRKEIHKVNSDGLSIDCIVYISNSNKGNIAQEGYIECIMEGLSHCGYNKIDYSHYKNFIGNNCKKSKSKLKNDPSNAELANDNNVLKNQELKNLVKEIQRSIFTNETFQRKCRSLFDPLNRLFDEYSYNKNIQVDAETYKFKKFLKNSFPEKYLEAFIYSISLERLEKLNPLILDDKIITEETGRRSDAISEENLHEELVKKAQNIHHQFINEYQKVRRSFTISKAKRCLEKLAALLYTVRSNISHGSKLEYQANERNENICEVIYYVLYDLINGLLEGGLNKIAAYGELKRNGGLFHKYVENNNGNFICEAYLNGNVSMNHNGEYTIDYASEVKNPVDILAFSNETSILRIDRIEMIPRELKPYYINNDIMGYAWVYCSPNSEEFKDTNYLDKDHIFSPDENTLLKERNITFLYALNGIKSRFKKINIPSNSVNEKKTAHLLIQKSKYSNYETNGIYGTKRQTIFKHPFAPNLINFIESIQSSYASVYQNKKTQEIISYIDDAIFEDKECNKKFYNNFCLKDEKELALKMYRNLISDITNFLAFKISKDPEDEDRMVQDLDDLWQELNKS